MQIYDVFDNSHYSFATKVEKFFKNPKLFLIVDEIF